MKKFLFLALVVFSATIVFAQETETKLLSFVIKPKSAAAFEQKMAAFAKANFKGEMNFRVQQVFGGKNDGNYVLSLSKLTSLGYYDSELYAKESKPFWAAFDKEIRPLIEEIHMNFLNYQKEYSSVAQQAYVTKVASTEREIRMGKMTDYQNLELEAKPVWESAGINLVVYRYVTGNTSKIVSIRRLSKGWSELDPGGSVLFKDAYIKMYSEAKYNEFIKAISDCTETINVQYQVFRPDLSNK